jgi:polyhydroxyalkanoate synthesis regulator phasin
MADEPLDMIMPMLREMRGEMREMRGEIGEIKQQLHKLEVGQKSIRNALTADTMMSKFITGDFEDRISELESQVEALKKGK